MLLGISDYTVCDDVDLVPLQTETRERVHCVWDGVASLRGPDRLHWHRGLPRAPGRRVVLVAILFLYCSKHQGQSSFRFLHFSSRSYCARNSITNVKSWWMYVFRWLSCACICCLKILSSSLSVYFLILLLNMKTLNTRAGWYGNFFYKNVFIFHNIWPILNLYGFLVTLKM